MKTPHAPRHSTEPVLVDDAGRQLWPDRRRWVPLAAVGSGLVLMGVTALAGIGLGSLFDADVATTVRTPSSSQSRPDTNTPWSTSTAEGPSAATSTEEGVVRVRPTTGTSPAPAATTAGRPVETTRSSTPPPEPTPSKTRRGKPDAGPSGTKGPKPSKPPKPPRPTKAS